MPMHKWMASAAGGTNQRLKPGFAIILSLLKIPLFGALIAPQWPAMFIITGLVTCNFGLPQIHPAPPIARRLNVRINVGFPMGANGNQAPCALAPKRVCQLAEPTSANAHRAQPPLPAQPAKAWRLARLESGGGTVREFRREDTRKSY